MNPKSIIMNIIVPLAITLFVSSWLFAGFVLPVHGLLYHVFNDSLYDVALYIASVITAIIFTALAVRESAWFAIIMLPILFALLFLGPLIMVFYAAISLIIIFEFIDEEKERKTVRVATIFLVASMTILILYGIGLFMGPFWSSELIAVQELDKPIPVSGLQRFIPLHTACTYASDRIQLPTHRIFCNDSYVYYANGSLIYNWIVEPEGFWNAISRGPAGAVFVYGDRYPPRVVFVEEPLAWGLHNLRLTPFYADSLWRHVVVAAGLDKEPVFEDNVETVYGGDVLVLVPVVGNTRTALAATPVLRGYVVVYGDGRTEYVDASAAAADPRFNGVPLVPEAVARRWVELYAHRVGVWEYYFAHNTITIRDVGSNPQPYLLRSGDGHLYWVFIAEPPGETHSAKYIIYVDAERLEPHVMVYELPEPMIGISKVESYVKQYHPTYDWNQLKIEEPMPIILEDRILWKTTVVTSDARGLVSVDIVDAKTSQVISIQPKKHITYLDVLERIQDYLAAAATGAANQTTTTPPADAAELLERVRALERRVNETIDNLEHILRELQRIEEALENLNTTG